MRCVGNDSTLKTIKIGDICDILNGFAFKSSEYVDYGIRVIRIANVQKGYIEDKAPQFYPEEKQPEIEHYMLQDGDLLISLTGNVGRVAILGKDMLPAVLNQRVACLRIKCADLIYKPFLFHLLNSDYFENQCILSSKGIAQKNLSTEWLKEYTFPQLEIKQQQQIAATLDQVTNLISHRKQQLTKLDELVKSRFIEMFGTENEFDKWTCCTVGDVADVCVGVVIKPTQYYTEYGIPAFRSLNIGEMQVKDNDWVFFTEEGHQKNQKSIIRENDVLVVRSGAPGTACVATKKQDGYNAVDIIIAHPNCDKIHPIFLAMFTNMPHGMNQIREQTGGAAQQHFNVGGYKELQLIMPPMELQECFASFAEQNDKSKFAIQQSLDKLEILKKSLMQEYFG